MADDATQDSTQESSAEQTAGESQSQEQTTQNDSHETGQGQNNDESGGKTDDKSSSTDQSAGSSDKSKIKDQDSRSDQKPLSRRSAAYRIQQLVQENTELKKQLNPQKQQQNDWDDEDASDDHKPSQQPNISKIVNEAVQAALKPVMTEHTKAADDAEINELFSGDNAADKPKYEDRIREMWKLPQYKDVAASDLYKITKYDELQSSIPAIQQQAVEDYKKAEKEAKESSASGNSNTSNRTGKGKSIAEMTDQELLEHNERVKAGQA